MKIMSANGMAPDWTPRFAASHLWLFCLPKSHKKTPGLYGLSALFNAHNVAFNKGCSSFSCNSGRSSSIRNSRG